MSCHMFWFLGDLLFLQFLFVVKANALTHEISKLCTQIQPTEARQATSASILCFYCLYMSLHLFYCAYFHTGMCACSHANKLLTYLLTYTSQWSVITACTVVQAVVTRWRVWALRTLPSFKIRTFQIPRWRTAAILKNRKNRHISATDWPISMIIGTIMQNGSPERTDR